MIRETKSRLGWTAWFELGVVLTIAPFLLFPRLPLTAWLLPAIPAIWLMRCATRTVGRTPLGKPVLLVLAGAAVGFMASYDQRVSFDKLAGILLGVALYHAIVHSARSAKVWVYTVAAFFALGLATALAALVGTNWAVYKLPVLQPIYAHLPVLLRGVPRAEPGFSPNEVGGTLTLFVSPLIGATIYVMPHLRRRPWRWAGWGMLALAGLLMTGTLVLTQSRLAIVSTALGLGFLGCLGGKRSRAATALIVIVCLAAMVQAGPGGWVHWLFRVDTLGEVANEVSWTGRVEIWNRSARALLDHVFTGVGLDTLPAVVHARYPLFLYPGDYAFTHAHNIYLQVALDLGLLGLIGYMGLLVAVFRQAWRVYRRSDAAWLQAGAASLLSGLLAYQVYGLADAITLGAKPGIFWWMLMALLVSARPDLPSKRL